jgi:hypothetical protein
MANRKPLIVVAGVMRELAPGDTLVRAALPVAYAASVTLDCSLADTFDITLTGNITVNFSNGYDGQKLMLRLRQGGTGGYTVTAGANVRYSDDLPSITLSTAVGKLDRIGYDCCVNVGAGTTTYDAYAYNRGFV